MNNQPDNQQQPRKTHAFSQFEDLKEIKNIHESPDKTAPDEKVDKPVAKPDQKQEKNKEKNTPSTEPVPSPKTKIGFKTPAEQQQK